MESTLIFEWAIADASLRMQKEFTDANPAMEDLIGDCRLYKMAADLFVCESEGPCPFSISFADRKICKNSLAIEQYKSGQV